MTITVRGAKGLDLAQHAAEFDVSDPDQAAYLASCRNIDLTIERAIIPRRGLQRATAWPGLLYDEATGNLYTGISGLTGPLSIIFPNPSAYTAKPGVST